MLISTWSSRLLTSPGTVREPDLAVVTREAFERVDRRAGSARDASACCRRDPLAGLVRTDQAIKHGEYADAGIGHYWMIDLGRAAALTACHLGGEFGYVDDPPVTGTFTAQHPFPCALDLGARRLSLRRRCAPRCRPAPSGCGSSPRRRVRR